MEYRFRLTKWECLVFMLGCWKKAYVKLKTIVFWMIYWLILTGDEVMDLMGRIGIQGAWIALCTVIFLIYAGGGYIVFGSRNLYRQSGGQERGLKLEDGMLQLRIKGCSMLPLSELSIGRENPWLLILNYVLPGATEISIIIPKRALGSKEDCRKFKQAITDGWKWKDKAPGIPAIEKSFYMNKVAVAHMMQATAGICKIVGKDYARLIREGYCQYLEGKRVVQLYPDRLVLQFGGKALIYGWQGLTRLVKVGGMYLFCFAEGTCMGNLPCCLFESAEEEGAFVRYCQECGMQLECVETDLCDVDPQEYQIVEVNEPQILTSVGVSNRDGINKSGVIKILLIWFLLGLAFIPLLRKASSEAEKAELEEEIRSEDYVFNPADFPDYKSLDEQVEVLESLGIHVSEECIEEQEYWIEESRISKVYVEGYPFYQVLCYLGCPEYDGESWDIVAYPEQVYWFDWEGYDVVADYIDILKAVENMSQGELVMADITVHDEAVDWEEGSGTLSISYICNGNPYKCSMIVRQDWLNENVIREINKMLKKEKLENRIYYCDDNGQGALLFYRDAEWARQFEEKTGISLKKR